VQALSERPVYFSAMPKAVSPLRHLREAAGLSLRELARQLGEHPSNVSYWETSAQPPRADLLPRIAIILGVTIEEILGQPAPRRSAALGGKAKQAFEAVAKLPRRQQEHILKVVNALVAQAAADQAA
jgi:transcriptional regulator with XRE-family HTH domain